MRWALKNGYEADRDCRKRHQSGWTNTCKGTETDDTVYEPGESPTAADLTARQEVRPGLGHRAGASRSQGCWPSG